MTHSSPPHFVDYVLYGLQIVAVGSWVQMERYANQLKGELAGNASAIKDTWQVVSKEIGLRVGHGKPPTARFPVVLKLTYAPNVWSAA